jgi:hypothetical protein
MNHCHRCECDFEKPGTCNCFAPQRAWTYPVPYYPYPWWGIYPPYNPVVIGGGTFVPNGMGGGNVTITWKAGQPLTSSYVKLNPACGGTSDNVAWSYTCSGGCKPGTCACGGHTWSDLPAG